MAYIKYTYRTPYFTEYEYKYAGRYGAAGEKRAKRRKATPEQIARQNQRIKEKYIRRLIALNFKPYDLWVTLKYPKESRPSISQVKEDFKRFMRKLRSRYKREGAVLKYIYRMELGKRGGIHLHMIVNRIRDSDKIIQKNWECGRAHFTSLYEEGGFKELAGYIVKQPEEVEKQLSLFPDEERKELCKYSSSRNLVRPQPEKREYRRWTLRKLIEEGAKPSEGCYIDPESVVQGINPYTGMSYYYYTEYPLQEKGG